MFETVNEHALNAILASTDKREILASEDIIDAESGVKLWAKGKRVDRALQQRLMMRKLSRPLEASLSVAQGVEAQTVLDVARAKLEQAPALAALCDNQTSRLLEVMGELKLEPPVQLLLTSAQDRGDGTFEHAVSVTIVATALALRSSLSRREVEQVALGGLLHDIGELYINPEYLTNKRELTPAEWSHVLAHPKVGAMLVQKMTSYSDTVSELIFSHHERMDGTGYPRQLSGRDLAKQAQMVSIAETITGILLHRDNPLIRASLALKLIFREYNADLVGLVTRSANGKPCELPAGLTDASARQALETLARELADAVQTALSLTRQPLTDNARRLAERCFVVTSKLYASLTATGAVECATELEAESSDAEVLLNLSVIPAEIRWRMRNLSREVEMALEKLEGNERASFEIMGKALAQGAGR